MSYDYLSNDEEIQELKEKVKNLKGLADSYDKRLDEIENEKIKLKKC